MGDIERCFFPGCTIEPKFVCDCELNQQFCKEHVQDHIIGN